MQRTPWRAAAALCASPPPTARPCISPSRTPAPALRRNTSPASTILFLPPRTPRATAEIAAPVSASPSPTAFCKNTRVRFASRAPSARAPHSISNSLLAGRHSMSDAGVLTRHPAGTAAVPATGRILIIDDEAEIRESLQTLLELEGYELTTAANGAKGLARVGEKPFDLVLLDKALPDQDGFEVLASLRERDNALPVIMITAYGTLENAVHAMQAGATNFIQKPWDNEKLLADVRETVRRRRVEEENVQLKRALKQRYSFDNIVGKSEPMLRIFDLIAQVAPSRSTVLIQGESGTGKEDVAKAIHLYSQPKDQPFVPFNTGFMPGALLPLRQRKEDIPLLVDHFLKKYSEENERPLRRIASESLRALVNHSWPGNVRELENVMERAVVLSNAAEIGMDLLPDHIANRQELIPLLDHTSDASLFDILEECERRILVSMLEKCNWNQTEAAERFRVPLSTLNQKIKRLSIEIKKKVRE